MPNIIFNKMTYTSFALCILKPCIYGRLGTGSQNIRGSIVWAKFNTISRVGTVSLPILYIFVYTF